MSLIDYRGGSWLSSLKTAGWFYLGLPILFLQSLLLTWPIMATYRRWGNRGLAVAWRLLGLIVVWTLAHQSPSARIAKIIGDEAARDISVFRLVSHDSFGDGTFTHGAFSGSLDRMQRIATALSLQPMSIARHQIFVPEILVEPDIDSDYWNVESGYGDARNLFYYCARTHTIYFRRQSRLPESPTEH